MKGCWLNRGLVVLGTLSLGVAAPIDAQHRHATHLTAYRIATGRSDGYQIVIADLNADGRADLLPVASGLSELAWFENPGWQRHVITGRLTRPENVAVRELDRDGIPEIGLVSGFARSPARSTGVVTVLTHRGDPASVWSAAEIDRLPTSHRARWADIDGSGNEVLVNAPLAGIAAQPPDLRADNPVVMYRPGVWQREVIGVSAGLVHGLYVGDWDGSERDTIITAGFAGVFADRFRNGTWTRSRVLGSDPAPWPGGGASEFTDLWMSGSLRRSSRGTVTRSSSTAGVTVSGYERSSTRRSGSVMASSASISTVTACRRSSWRTEATTGGASTSIAGPGPAMGDWSKEILAGGMQASSCAAGDLVCIGRATEELTWHRNVAAGGGAGGG